MKKRYVAILCIFCSVVLFLCGACSPTKRDEVGVPPENGGDSQENDGDSARMMIRLTPEFIKGCVDKSLGENTPLESVTITFGDDNLISCESTVDVAKLADYLRDEGAVDDTAAAAIYAAGLLVGTVDVACVATVGEVVDGVPAVNVGALSIEELTIQESGITRSMGEALQSAIASGMDGQLFSISEVRTDDGNLLVYLQPGKIK